MLECPRPLVPHCCGRKNSGLTEAKVWMKRAGPFIQAMAQNTVFQVYLEQSGLASHQKLNAKEISLFILVSQLAPRKTIYPPLPFPGVDLSPCPTNKLCGVKYCIKVMPDKISSSFDAPEDV